MKITIVHGSPRPKGNSHAIVKAFCSTAEKNTRDIRVYEMNRLSAKGCQGCAACKGKVDVCPVKDDLTEAFERVHETDILVIASPVYFGDVSSQAKIFIDRLYQLFKPNFHEGFDPETISYNGVHVSRLTKTPDLVFVTTQGARAPEIQVDIHPRYDRFFQWLGFHKVHHIRGLGDPGHSDDHLIDEAMQQARELAEYLTGK